MWIAFQVWNGQRLQNILTLNPIPLWKSESQNGQIEENEIALCRRLPNFILSSRVFSFVVSMPKLHIMYNFRWWQAKIRPNESSHENVMENIRKMELFIFNWQNKMKRITRYTQKWIRNETLLTMTTNCMMVHLICRCSFSFSTTVVSHFVVTMFFNPFEMNTGASSAVAGRYTSGIHFRICIHIYVYIYILPNEICGKWQVPNTAWKKNMQTFFTENRLCNSLPRDFRLCVRYAFNAFNAHLYCVICSESADPVRTVRISNSQFTKTHTKAKAQFSVFRFGKCLSNWTSCLESFNENGFRKAGIGNENSRREIFSTAHIAICTTCD